MRVDLHAEKRARRDSRLHCAALIVHGAGVSAKSKLEVFELIAEDDATSSYLARWDAASWIVLRRARHERAAAGMERLAALVQAIEHANVVRTYDPAGALGELERSVLLEEFVQGERLADWMYALGAQRLPWRVAAAIIRDAALGAQAVQIACNSDPRALSALWPDRLVVGFDGMVKLIDPVAELRGVPVRAGAEEYLAPEARSGSPHLSSVVYSLAQMLQQLLPPVTPAQDPPPRALERILSRALAPSAEDRFRTPAELAAGLDALLDDPEPVRAFFESTFAAERAAQADALAQLAAHAAPAPKAPTAASDFSDEEQTAVLQAPPAEPSTLPDLSSYDDSAETEELSLVGLGSYAPDADEDLRTRPFRRQLLSKLKKSERETLERGGARVSVPPTAIPAAYAGGTPEAQSVLLTDGAATGELAAAQQEAQPLPSPSAAVPPAPLPSPSVPPSPLPSAQPEQKATKPSAAETVVIRAITEEEAGKRTSRLGDYLVLLVVSVLVVAIAYWAISIN